MTDSARSAPLDRAEPASAPLPDLPTLIRGGEWRRALAVVRVGGLDPELEGALLHVHDLQVALRARRYPAARRALAAYRTALPHLGDPALRDELRARADPDTVAAALEALERLQRETDPDTLAAGLAPALAEPLTRAEALNLRGVLHALQGDPAQARTLFLGAAEADAGHYRSRSNLGNLDLEAGDYPAAEARYREVIALNPEYDGGHHNLGVALRKQGKVWDGVQAIKRGQKLNVKQAKADAKAEAQEQLRQDPRLRTLRWVLLAVVAALVVWALLGRG